MSAPKELRRGRYALLRKLGEGTQGETWEAVDRGPQPNDARRDVPLTEQWSSYVAKNAKGAAAAFAEREARSRQRAGRGFGGGAPIQVAVKCFRLGTAKTWKDFELAEREARTLASLDHGSLPRYVEHFEEDGALYLVMEKIEGESLASLRAKGRTLAPGEVARMLEDIADALRYLHGRAPAIVHRDIKPGNVIRRPNGSFALVDFGAVRDKLKPTGGSTVVGTFGYMAPEQFQGRASPKSDVYGLGATALTMLTGCEPEELPHAGLAIDVARSVPDNTAPGLVRALEAMLEPDPDRRVASVDTAIALLTEPVRKEKKARKKRRLEKKRAARTRDALEPHRGPGDPRPGLVWRLVAILALAGVASAVASASPHAVIPIVLIFMILMLSLVFSAVVPTNAWLGRRRRLRGLPEPRLRVEAPTEQVRIGAESAESYESEEEYESLDEELTPTHEEEKRRRARMREHATPPPRRKHWGR